MIKVMKSTWIYGLLSLLTVASASFGVTYTLEALLELGFAHSREIKIVEEEMKKTEAQVKEYYGMAFPKLDFNSYYQYAPNQFNPLSTGEDTEDMSITQLLGDNLVDPASEPGAYILGGIFDGMMGGLTPKKHLANLELSLTQPLFSQGKVVTGLKIAKLYNRVLLCKWQDVKMQVKANISRLFYSGLLAEKNNEIQSNAITLAEEGHRLAVLRYNSGKGTELDTLNTRLNLESSRIAYQEAIKGRNMALDALKKSVGLTDNLEDITLSGDFPEDDYSINLDKAIKYVQSENKNVIQLNVSREIQHKLVKIAKSDYLPLVYCGAAAGWTTQFNRDEDVIWQDDQKVFIGMSYNLFSGLQRHQKIKQAKNNARTMEENRELAIEGLELATRNAWEGLETSRKKLAQAKSMVALAEKAYNVSKKAYELGGVTLLDFQDSEQKVNGARIAYNAALFEFFNAVVDMRLLMGDYLYDEKDK